MEKKRLGETRNENQRDKNGEEIGNKLRFLDKDQFEWRTFFFAFSPRKLKTTECRD